jgi:6-phosphogluconolactonase
MTVTRHDWPDAVTLRREMAVRVADLLRHRIEARGEAWLAVSGGRTPAGLLDVLSETELDWAKVTVTLVDERWVDETSPRSNMALVRKHLHTGKAFLARFVPLHTPGVTLNDGRDNAEQRLRDLPFGLAVAILGMGDDGHTASWFPGGDRLGQALDPASTRLIETMQAPAAGEPRLTLTLPALLSADALVLHIEGVSKQATLARALGPGAVEAMPVRAVLRQDRVPLEIHWAP